MNEILGILGLQGWGKTALTTGFGYLAYMNGYKIYSNYPLSFDYTPIKSLKDAKNVRNGYLLFDEFWRWVHARTSQSSINKEMMGICLLNRKRNVSIIYNTQLPRTIDVILRDVTNYRYLPHLEPHNDGKRYVHYIMRDLLNRESDEMFYNMPIDELGKLFNTRYEVEDIDADKNESFLEIGKELEKKCLIAINRMKGFKATRLPNSGIGTDFKGDLLINTPNGNYLGDVKSTTDSGFIVFCDSEHTIKKEVNKFIDNSKQWDFKPCIIYPKLGKDGNYLKHPNNWYIYFINGNSYLLDIKANIVRYPKLIKKSIFMKNWGKLT